MSLIMLILNYSVTVEVASLESIALNLAGGSLLLVSLTAESPGRLIAAARLAGSLLLIYGD